MVYGTIGKNNFRLIVLQLDPCMELDAGHKIFIAFLWKIVLIFGWFRFGHGIISHNDLLL
jgi:hypothetical protein